MKIELTEFAKRHFDPSFRGTIIDRSPEDFMTELRLFGAPGVHREGYASFCRLLFYENWTNAPTGVVAITLENEKYLRSGYQARQDGELPVLCRWFEGIVAPKARFLCVVIYSKEQCKKEGTPIEDDWGIVTILGQDTDYEQPMAPATIIRNSLGVKFGGSGAPLDRDAYLKGIEFWEKHATVQRI